jgi:4-hydroxyphenylacetate 3-monooxygenase
MHTALPFANEVYVGQYGPLEVDNNRYTFVVDVGSPGVTVLCRKIAIRHENRFIAPLSSRYDELDAQMWLDDVFVPYEKIFLTEPPPGESSPHAYDAHRGESIATWLWWHQLYCWLMKGEFTLGLALACADAMGLKEHQQTIEYLLDMVVDVQTVRSCITAAELDPEMTHCGYAAPRPAHVAAGSLAMLKARQRLTETLRSLPGSSLIIAPADTDLADPSMQQGLEDTFGGGGYTALQRSALLNMAWDHIASGLDGRESAFELYANGGVPVWRTRLRGWFESYNVLANAVLRQLDIDMPEIDVSNLSQVAFGQRRPVGPAPSAPASRPATGSQASSVNRRTANRH